MSIAKELDVSIEAGHVQFVFIARNTGPEPVELTFSSSLLVDFAVYDGSEEIWRSSDGQLFTQALEDRTLASGETLTQTAQWKDPDKGQYEAVASLKSRDAPITARQSFRV